MTLSNPILNATLNHISLAEIKKEKGPPNWSHQVVLAEHVVGVVIYQNPGTENDRHSFDGQRRQQRIDTGL